MIYISLETKTDSNLKTQFGFHLAETLLKCGHSVLYVDTDITGVDLTDSDLPECVHTITLNSNPVNLTWLWDRNWMAGFRHTKVDLKYDKNKVNLYGSNIYHEGEVLQSPGTLFDELHVFWWMEYLEFISENFDINFGQQEKETVVIFDNSYGYIGLIPPIHEWLTDVGPSQAKTIMITNKPNDSESERGVGLVRSLFSMKWKVAQLCLETAARKKIDKERYENISEGRETRFLIDWTTQAERSSNKRLAFYRDINNQKYVKEMSRDYKLMYIEKGNVLAHVLALLNEWDLR